VRPLHLEVHAVQMPGSAICGRHPRRPRCAALLRSAGRFGAEDVLDFDEATIIMKPPLIYA
jgi:hypothetical protein